MSYFLKKKNKEVKSRVFYLMRNCPSNELMAYDAVDNEILYKSKVYVNLNGEEYSGIALACNSPSGQLHSLNIPDNRSA